MPDDVTTVEDDVTTVEGEPAADLQPPVRRSPGMRPALLVLGIAVLLVLGFGLASAFVGQGQPPAPSTKPQKVAGTGLRAVPSGTALKPIEQPGTPPTNIIDALTLPQGAVATSHTDNSTSATGYDEQIDFSLPGATQAQVVAFYKAELNTRGWRQINVGPATNQPGTTQVLAQAAGDDGWYWEAGALVGPTVFGGGHSETTPFTIRLFQVPDAD